MVIYIHKFKKVTWFAAGRCGFVCVGVCVGVCLCHRAVSFTYFGEVLRCPHKRIVTTTKVYIARNNIHVELIRFRKHSDFIDIGNFEVGIRPYSFARGDQIEVFKILNGYENIDSNIFFEIKKSKITRGHNFTLVKKQSRLDVSKYSFSQRTINVWNKLSTDCVHATSVNVFKNRIDKYLVKAGYT